MLFADSWIWIEFFSKDERWRRAEEVLQSMEEEGGIIATTVLMEVRYRIKRKFGEEKADRVLNDILSFENLEVMPVTAEVATYAADLRDKYYEEGELELSYADAIHLATAVMTGCERLCTGDPDFKDIGDIDTTII